MANKMKKIIVKSSCAILIGIISCAIGEITGCEWLFGWFGGIIFTIMNYEIFS